MPIPFITADPARFRPAAARIALREREKRRAFVAPPGWFTRLFRPTAAHARTTRACRLGPKETVLTNL